jgi:hypothetical protein
MGGKLEEYYKKVLQAIARGWYEPAPPWAMQEDYGKKRLSRRAMMKLARKALND